MLRIKYWKESDKEKNFGDFLSEYISTKLFVGPVVAADIFRIIGSCIDEKNIGDDLDEVADPRARIVFWCCGMRNEAPLPDEVRRHCTFFGVRGPLSRRGLSLPEDTALGDPGLLLPLLYRPKRRLEMEGKTLCIPHFSQIGSLEERRAQAGCDIALAPVAGTVQEVETLIDAICSAEFVVAGSLHAAIVACAYGRPFGFLDSGFIDIPFKWRDFALSLGVDIPFAATLAEARRSYAAVSPALRKPALAPILGCCPFLVAPEALLRAVAHDAGLEDDLLARMLAVVGSSASQDGTLKRQVSTLVAERDRDNLWSRSLEQDWRALASKVQGLKRMLATRRHARLASADARLGRLDFTAGALGASLLGEGWTSPGTDYGPWSLQPSASLVIPGTLRWDRADKLVFHGLFFVPRSGSGPGIRRIEIWIDDRLCTVWVLRNETDQPVIWSSMSVELSGATPGADGDMAMRFLADTVGTPASLGITDDDRHIGFAPTFVEASFPDA